MRTHQIHKTPGFTLLELLVVIGIIALLAAILFPVFVQVRRKSYETTCVSNLKQIGLATLAYSQDYDDRFPLGGDPADINFLSSWSGSPFYEQVKALKPLPDVLFPYTKSKAIWHCPTDSGFKSDDLVVDGTIFDTLPSSFEKYQSSYYYYTSLALENQSVANVQQWNQNAPHEEHGPSQVVLLHDGSGAWHGGGPASFRYAALFVDGHAKVLSKNEMIQAFNVVSEKP